MEGLLAFALKIQLDLQSKQLQDQTTVFAPSGRHPTANQQQIKTATRESEEEVAGHGH